MGIEGGPVAVDEGGAELLLGELASAGFIDGFEEREEGGIGGAFGAWGGSCGRS